jgi:hypothetical protein
MKAVHLTSLVDFFAFTRQHVRTRKITTSVNIEHAGADKEPKVIRTSERFTAHTISKHCMMATINVGINGFGRIGR